MNETAPRNPTRFEVDRWHGIEDCKNENDYRDGRINLSQMLDNRDRLDQKRRDLLRKFNLYN